MASVADKIMRRVRAHGRGKRVYTPKDFLDLGSRASVDQALSSLARGGELRRIARGFYDWPRWSDFLQCLVPPKTDLIVAALARRDGIRFMEDGISAANMLRLTNAVPIQEAYLTDGPTRNLKIDRRTIYLRHAAPKVMSWTGKPSAPVMLALRWLGPLIVTSNPSILRTLRSVLPDRIKADFIRNSAHLPHWAARIADDLTEPEANTP